MKLLNKKIIKNKSGITLVALVVTIVILLILAGITIATLFGENGIIKMAQKAKDETEKVQEETEKQLQNLENELSNTIGDKIESPNEWTQPDPLKPEITNGEITLKIGEYVDYDCTTSGATYTSPKEKTGHTGDQVFKANEYQYGWRVLGVDKQTKQLQLISEDFAQPTEGGTTLGVRKGYILKGQEGYVNGIEELNKICSIYGNGKGAVSARSVSDDDVNKITGYNPNNIGVKDPSQTGTGEKYQQNNILEYGNNVTYTLVSGGVKYESNNNGENRTGSIHTKLTYYDEVSKIWKNLGINDVVTLKSNLYMYYPTTLNETSGLTASTGIANTSIEYKMLFTNSSTGADITNSGNINNFQYWLGSSYLRTDTGFAYYGLRSVKPGRVFSETLYYTYGHLDNPNCGIRPVVTISSKIQLKDSGTTKDNCKLYNLIVPQD